MTRRTYVVHGKTRDAIHREVVRAPDGYRVTFEEPLRTGEQNALLWVWLSEIARQRPVHNGARMTADLWKAVFMQALGAEMVMLPTLDGDGFFPLGHRSSRLSKAEFAGLLTLIDAWSAREGVVLERQAA
ncbi:MAG: recombination protein NinB [Pseudomonadota bacterium]